ncbi:N-acetyl sugar amidotransferase [Daejeonella lutea]|uniref:N-acetyl sugar amidotransferase n=1 Tax=Daejeonella lutea TaxID=572036 RepID=A0A1T5FB11_9SPHI|nr:N-acetyl sugar amidotransferase [Daejeonella lutea]SKB93334.1 N-acetyl sugar amidotransferase [Daejeonella lutea]
MKNSSAAYQQCNRCVMDTSDPLIEFDEIGNCNHCNKYIEQLPNTIIRGPEGLAELDKLLERARQSGQGKKYDVIMGVSGGMDSSYVAYRAKHFGLRILAVHLDNGWNSELSVKNIENCIKYAGADLFTHVIDWEEFKSMQVAYLKAGVIDIEALTDHAIRSIIYKLTDKYKIEYNLSGSNYTTEGILPNSWVYNKLDYKNIRSISRRFGARRHRTFPGMSLGKYIYYRAFAKIKPIDVLNLIDYKVDTAIQDMENDMGWKYYGGKHHESIFTKFYQGYILPEKFGVDKRKAHYSTLICSGNMTREDALLKLRSDIYTANELDNDMEYVLKKLGITESAFKKIMQEPVRSHLDYPNNNALFQFFKRFS